MYARNAMLVASQANPNLERGCINLDAGMSLAEGGGGKGVEFAASMA